jgi:hypothetical protein
MQTFICVVALVVTLLATSSASAQTPTQIGPGAVSCANWLKERLVNSRMSLIMNGWVLGYLSGASVMKQATGEDAPDALRGVGEATIFDWIDKYCSAHRSDELVQATIQLQAMLRQKAKDR